MPGSRRDGRALTGAAWVAAWTAQIGMAAILSQTLFFKFTYAPETRYIFATIGGRPAATAVGIVELACVVLLLVPRTAAAGALLALGTMMGAIGTHLTRIGVVVVDPETGRGDGGLLFSLALAVAAMACLVLVLRRGEWLPRVRARLGARGGGASS